MSFCVILVEPEHPHNIGFCARAMRSNGLTDLRIVRGKALPRMAWDTAHASAEILDQAQILPALCDALADCQASVAFSRRVFHTVQPHLALPELSQWEPIQRDRVALVFGRESCGLNHDEISLCSVQCEIPVAGNMSLNLAQAVSVSLYELCRAGLLSDRPGLAKRNRVRNPPTSTGTGQAEWEALVHYVTERLQGQSAHTGWSDTAIRKWLHRLAPDSLELRALFGVVRDLAEGNSRQQKKESRPHA